jgi:hypothetical protein
VRAVRIHWDKIHRTIVSMKCFVSVVALTGVPCVLGHGMLLKPVSRALRFTTNTTSPAPQFAGGCDGASCTW